MAELKFDCPQCGQPISCDELWGGHNIECPTCKTELTVPQLHAAPPPPAAAARATTPDSLRPQPPSATKLSIGRSQHPSAAPANPAARAPQAMRRPVEVEKKSGAMKIVKIAAVVIALGVGGYFGFGLVSNWQEKANEKRRQAEKNADGGELGHIGELYNVLDATEPGGRGLGGRPRGSVPGSRQSTGPRVIPIGADGKPVAQPAPAELPVIPPMFTLEVETAKIPEGKANGMISGTNFVAESARLDTVASGGQVLRLTQGQAASPDREILIYLHPKPGESLVGHTFSVAKDVKGTEVSQVGKRWKTNPKYAPQFKAFATGYALKLELGHISEGMITGKIFLALPDPEQSVVAGIFKATTSLVEAPAAAAAGTAAPAPALAPAPGGASAAEKAAFEKRYGVKR